MCLQSSRDLHSNQYALGNRRLDICRHALSTDCDLSKAPRRRTDGAIVLDTEFYVTKFYTTDGGVKMIKRQSGSIERQYRVNMGKLPIGYRSDFSHTAYTAYFTSAPETRLMELCSLANVYTIQMKSNKRDMQYVMSHT